MASPHAHFPYYPFQDLERKLSTKQLIPYIPLSLSLDHSPILKVSITAFFIRQGNDQVVDSRDKKVRMELLRDRRKVGMPKAHC